MCRSVYPTATADPTRRRDALERSSPASIIGYCDVLDTRTTPAGKQPLTATRRVHNVEGWRCNERGHEHDFAVRAGGCPSAANGIRCQRNLPGRRTPAARFAVR